MYCSNCGKEIPDNAKFCGYCGATADGLEADSGVEARIEKAAVIDDILDSSTAKGQRKNKKKRGLAIGIVAVIAVIAVVVFATFFIKSQNAKTEAAAFEPIDRINAAAETGSYDMFLSAFEDVDESYWHGDEDIWDDFFSNNRYSLISSNRVDTSNKDEIFELYDISAESTECVDFYDFKVLNNNVLLNNRSVDRFLVGKSPTGEWKVISHFVSFAPIIEVEPELDEVVNDILKAAQEGDLESLYDHSFLSYFYDYEIGTNVLIKDELEDLYNDCKDVNDSVLFIGSNGNTVGEDQKFYWPYTQIKDYAAVMHNEDYRYSVADSSLFSSAVQAQAFLAVTNGKGSFSYHDVDYTVEVVTEGEFFIVRHDGDIVGLGCKELVTPSDGSTPSFQFTYDALMAHANGGSEFTTDGKTYTMDEDGIIYDNGTEVACVSEYIVKAIMGDVVFSREFKNELIDAAESGQKSFMYTDENGIVSLYILKYDAAHRLWDVQQETSTRILDLPDVREVEKDLGAFIDRIAYTYALDDNDRMTLHDKVDVFMDEYSAWRIEAKRIVLCYSETDNTSSNEDNKGWTTIYLAKVKDKWYWLDEDCYLWLAEPADQYNPFPYS